MRVECPNCYSPVVVGAETELSKIWCASCQTTFKLSEEDTLEANSTGSLLAKPSFIPKTIGRFRLIRQIGHGSAGVVWQAIDEKLSLTVAIKLPGKTYSRSTIDRFQQEAETVARLNHPNIGAVHKWGVEDGQPYIASEFIQGKSLDEWRKLNSPSPRESAKLCKKLAHALDHAHQRQVIHRDLKPSNIIVDADGEPHIVDFGLAIQNIEIDARKSGEVLGTPAYASPEQVNGRHEKIDSRTDVYSLGVVLYELLTGTRPHTGDRIFAKIANEAPRPPRELNKRIPHDLQFICLKCLEKEPGQRFAYSRSLFDELRRFIAGEQITASRKTWLHGWYGALLRQFNLLSVFLLIFLLVALIPFANQLYRIVFASVTSLIATSIWYFVRTFVSKADSTESRQIAGLESEVQRLFSKHEMLVKTLNKRTQMLIATQQEHQLYQSLLESLPLCVYRKDLQGRFSFVNDVFCKTVNVRQDRLIGGTSQEVFAQVLAEKHATDESRVVGSKEIDESIEEFTSNGDTVIFEVLKSPVRNFNGETVGIQCLMWDVSAHTRVEHALRDAIDAAEAANMAKSSFLANVSHELRTPMNAIIGITELIAESDLSDKQQDYVRMIQDSGHSLLRIINDLLSFSTIEAGKLELKTSDFSVHSALESIVGTLKVTADKKVTFLHQVAPEIPKRLHGDAARLRQVVVNLVGNAIKFTEQGEVRINARMQEVRDDHLVLLFEVSDTGIGIPREKIDAIFEPFEQVDTSPSRKYGGTGLGLAVTAEIVSAMGGEIWVVSEPRKGSRFFFTVALSESQGQNDDDRSHCKKENCCRPLRILLVDDVETNQLLVRHRLEQRGHQLELADCGSKALEHYESNVFDLILMDVQMPGMDGFETTRRIREKEGSSGNRIPIIAMTAHAMEGDRDCCLQVGMDGYVSKPIDWAELDTVIENLSPPALPNDDLLVSESQLIDRVDGNHAFLSRLINSFLKLSPKMLSEVVCAAEAGDADQLKHSTHKLKGAISNLLGEHGVDSILILESQAQEGRLVNADVERETQKLKKQMNMLIHQLTVILERLST